MSRIEFMEVCEGLPISQGVVAGDFLYTAGIGEDLDPSDPKPMMRRVFETLKTILETKGLGFADVVKISAALSRTEDFGPYNEVYREYFHEPFPVRTTLPINAAEPMLEVDLVAYRPGLSG
jgi:2-iminobutanoate/2-iminopropanoate deaminase